jgi:hypothetical protein
MEVGKSVPEGLVLTKQSPRPPQHGRKMLTPINAMDKPAKAAPKLILASTRNGCSRLRAQEGEYPIDASPRGHRVSEREARCNQSYNLLVWRIMIAMNEIDRVSRSGRLGVASSEQGVQVFADTVHFSGVLAILPSQLQ